MFFLFFVVPHAESGQPAELMATYAGFACLGVAFFQFGVGIAVDRASPWDLYVRTLPIGPVTRLAGRVLSAAAFASAAEAGVIGLALATTEASLSVRSWLVVGACLVVGTVPFSLLGIALGFIATPKAALPLANVLYLSLAYLGGLWTGPHALPVAIDRLSVALPTREWADLLSAAARGASTPIGDVTALAGWTIGFAFLGAWAYRRDEGVRFA
jgi:ABC-2 type transport system permease protein